MLHALAHHVFPPARFIVHVWQLKPDHVNEEPLRKPVLAHDPGGNGATLCSEFEVSIRRDHHQAVAFHACHCLRHSRSGVAKLFGNARAHGRDAIFDQFVDGPEVHLCGVDEVTHGVYLPSPR